jgi:Domain of unknown function (DUF4328)
MTDINYTPSEGMGFNTKFKTFGLASLALQLFALLVSIPYLLMMGSYLMKNPNAVVESFTKAPDPEYLKIATDYLPYTLASSFFYLIGGIVGIVAIVYLAKTVLNYYRTYQQNAKDARYTASGATWSYFIPFLNLIRPFNVMNEVLKKEDTDVKNTQYIVIGSLILSIISIILSANMYVAIVTSLIGLVLSYLLITNLYKIHNRILEDQEKNNLQHTR